MFGDAPTAFGEMAFGKDSNGRKGGGNVGRNANAIIQAAADHGGLPVSTGVAMTTKPMRQQDGNSPEGELVDDLSIEYPSSDGEPMAESDLQYVPLTETVSTLRVRFSNRPDVYVAGDMLVYYRPNEPSASVAPDVFAVFGTTGNHPRDSWIVWREGKAPDFVLEIASESAWRRDVEEKRRIYAEMGVSEYWRFDPTGRCFTPALMGEMLVDGEYRPGAMSGGGGASGELRGHSHVLGLDFVVEPGLRLRVYDPVSGERLRNHEEAEAEVLRLRSLLEESESSQ